MWRSYQTETAHNQTIYWCQRYTLLCIPTQGVHNVLLINTNIFTKWWNTFKTHKARKKRLSFLANQILKIYTCLSPHVLRFFNLHFIFWHMLMACANFCTVCCLKTNLIMTRSILLTHSIKYLAVCFEREGRLYDLFGRVCHWNGFLNLFSCELIWLVLIVNVSINCLPKSEKKTVPGDIFCTILQLTYVNSGGRWVPTSTFFWLHTFQSEYYHDSLKCKMDIDIP